MGVVFASNQNLAAEKAVKDGHTLHRLPAKEVRGMKTLAVIPARYSSTRLPGKPMIEIAGVPLVIRVLDNVSACASVPAERPEQPATDKTNSDATNNTFIFLNISDTSSLVF